LQDISQAVKHGLDSTNRKLSRNLY